MDTTSIWSDYAFDQIPFKEVVHLGQRSLINRDIFVVSWLLGRYCNYRCSYCWPYARADEKDHRPLEVIQATMDEIKRQARERGFYSFHFSFSGGEPTFHPRYLDIVQYYASDTANCHYQSIHMTSNCSHKLSWFEKYIHATRPLHRVSVTASYHKEFARRDEFVEKLVFLQTHDVQVTINMVMVPERFEELWADAMHFHNQGLNVTLKPQSNASAEKIVEGYAADQLKTLRLGMPQLNFTGERMQHLNRESSRPKPNWPVDADRTHPAYQTRMQVALTDEVGGKYFIDQAERLNAFEFNKFTDWECSSGYRSLVIREPGGVIKRSYSCHDEPLGTIEDGFQLFSNVNPCRTRSCVSSADSKIPKRKAGVKFPLWNQYGKPK